METVFDTENGVTLTVRGNPYIEKGHHGHEWRCEDVEVQNPKTKSWHTLTNENIGTDAEHALCKLAESYNPYVEGDLEPPARYL